MIHISFYVPIKDAEKVKNAMFHAGAGRIGNYDSCSFEVKGIGQFRPLAESRPAIGTQNILEIVEEVKVEMVCEEAIIQEVISALKKSHPYETPAYYAIKTLNY